MIFNCKVCGKHTSQFEYKDKYNSSPLYYRHEQQGPIDDDKNFWQDYIDDKYWIEIYCSPGCSQKDYEKNNRVQR